MDKDIENKFYLVISDCMINVKEFVYNKLKDSTTLTWYVWTNIFPNVMPQGNKTFPIVIFSRISSWKIDLKGIRNEYIQVSVWGKSIKDNEAIMGVISSIFNGLQESPVKHCDVQRFDETFDTETQTFGNHVTIHVKMFDPIV